MTECELTRLSSESIPERCLVFLRPIPFRVEACSEGWSASFPTLGYRRQGATALTARILLVDAVYHDACRLIRTYTSDLSEADLHRKWVLLGALDVRASKIDAPPPGSYWFLGTLHRDDGDVLWLRTEGNRTLWFKLDDALQQTPVDTMLHLAEVRNDSLGCPIGPVLTLQSYPTPA